MITVSYNAYCAISKEGDNDIWTVWPLLPLCSKIDVGATVNALLGDTFSRENNTHGSRFHKRDPQFASRILGAMTRSCYIGTRDIGSRVIRGPYCTSFSEPYLFFYCNFWWYWCDIMWTALWNWMNFRVFIYQTGSFLFDHHYLFLTKTVGNMWYMYLEELVQFEIN